MDKFSDTTLGSRLGRAGYRLSLVAAATAAVALASPDQASAAWFKAGTTAVAKGALKRAKLWTMSGGIGSVLSKVSTGSWTHHLTSLKTIGMFAGGGLSVAASRAAYRGVTHLSGGKPKRTIAKAALGFGVFAGLTLTTFAAVNLFGGGDVVQTSVRTGAETLVKLHDKGLLSPFGVLHGVRDGATWLVSHGPQVTSFSLGALSELLAGRK